MEFDKGKWQEFDAGYLNRNKMLKDLTTNYKLTGVKYSQIITLLDSPDFKDGNMLLYNIKEYYGWDIDPIGSKNLIFHLNNDSTIKDFSIYENKK